MKRVRRSARRVALLDPFEVLPDELLPLLVDAVCTVSADPFRALYKQLPLLSRRWHRACGTLDALEVTTVARFATAMCFQYQDIPPDWGVESYICCNSSGLVSSLKHPLCAFRDHTWFILLHLVALCHAKELPVKRPDELRIRLDKDWTALAAVLTPHETFQLCRLVYRARLLHYRHDREPQACPAKTGALNTLFLRLDCADEGRVIFVPLWALRYEMTRNKAGAAALATTPYQSLYYKGMKLMPQSYDRVVLPNAQLQGPPLPENCITRTLYALSSEERTAFLARHSERIDQLLRYPGHLYRYDKHKTADFVHYLDVCIPRIEEDTLMLNTVAGRLCALLLKTHPESWIAEAIRALKLNESSLASGSGQ